MAAMISSDPQPPATDNIARPGTPPAIGPVGWSGPERRVPLKWWVILAVALVLAYGVWQYPTWKGMAEAGTAYGARVGCSCRYVQGRDLKSCETDFEPGMEMISLSEDPKAKRITASAPLLASHSAVYAGETGCLLEVK